MKKFTFLFIAAVMAVSANAQLGFSEGGVGQIGNYDLETGTWLNVEPAANQEFTLAVKVTDETALTWLAGDPGRTIAMGDFRINLNNDEATNKASFRLIPMGNNLYAVNLVMKQLMPDKNWSLLNEDNKYCHFQVTGASITDGTWDYNAYGYGNIAIGVVAGADAAQITRESLGDGEPTVGISSPRVVSAGIEDVFANPQQVERVEFFNLQGMKLQAEPVEGLFIAVPYYKGGVRGEARKVLNAK
jgi:hypothetical protein